METTNRVTRKDASGYDQVVAESGSSSGTTGENSSQVQEGRSDRALTSESTANGSKENKSQQDSSSARDVNSSTRTSGTSTQKANIGFTLSFSIPLIGITPSTCK